MSRDLIFFKSYDLLIIFFFLISLSICFKMLTKKRTILSAAQKRELCETKENEPNLSNVALAQKYNIGKSTVTDILNEKERWLAISGDQGNIKKFRGPKWPQLENALSLWVENALNTKQDIDGNILKTKANFFARQF